MGQGKRVGLWHNFEQSEESKHEAAAFSGKVVEVHSGDCVTVEKDSDFSLLRLFLASVKAPKVAPVPEQCEPYAWEAKEALRKVAIGKRVHVETEYAREIPLKSGVTTLMTFSSVFLLKNNKNLGVLQLEKGVARTNM